MKNLYITLLASCFIWINIFNINAEIIHLFIDSDATVTPGETTGNNWDNAFPSVECALQYTDVTNSDVTIFIKHGEQAPIKIWNTGMKKLTIYGGCDGTEFSANDRYLEEPLTRTIIQGTETQPAIWIEGLPNTHINVIDGLSLVGGGWTESLSIRVIDACNIVFSRCRIEGISSPGNLIYLEGINSAANSNCKVSFVNSIINDNQYATNIVKTFFNCCFVNSTIVNNSCENFMEMVNPQNYNDYEIKNSIICNTTCETTGANIKVYNSSVPNFRYFFDFGGNTSGLNIEFTGNDYDPYEHIPNQYITARGDINFYREYIGVIPQDNRDIINNMRYERLEQTIDLGPYQGVQVYARSYAPEFINEENNMSLNNISIYPTRLNSGETLHFEHNLDNSLLVKIYNSSGTEVMSQEITNNDNILLLLPTGIYIVAMCNPETQEIAHQEKIVVTN